MHTENDCWFEYYKAVNLVSTPKVNTEIVEWQVAAGAWQYNDAFEDIDDAADARNDELDDNWNAINYVLDGL